MSTFQIDINQNLIDFKHKLETEPRVVLSAGFGDGKTYFLKRFEETYEKDYHFITIYPAQYIVSSNESIIEYVKRDILFQLIDKELVTEELDLVGILRDAMESVDINEVLEFFASKPVARMLGKAIDGIKILQNKLDQHTLSANKYLDSFLSVKGGLYENDAFTCLIRRCFDRIREKDGKELVLVIEDLDRIAPVNVFTLLNIFGSHFDRHYVVGEGEEENKFGFDRLVTVMDYENIRLLYNHMFGDEEQQSGFEGYMAKYICSHPFYYSIRRDARKAIVEKIYSLYGFTNPSDVAMKKIIDEQLKEMTIRDLERVFLFNPQGMLRKPSEPLSINGFLLSPNNPLVSIIAYKVFFGLSFDFSRSLDKYPDELTQIEAVGPLLLMKKSQPEDKINGFKYNEGLFPLKLEYDSDGYISAFRFRKSNGLAYPMLNVAGLTNSVDYVKHGIWTVEEQFNQYFYYSGEKEEEEEEDLVKSDEGEEELF